MVQNWIGRDETIRFRNVKKHNSRSPAFFGTFNDEHALGRYRVEQQPSIIRFLELSVFRQYYLLPDTLVFHF